MFEWITDTVNAVIEVITGGSNSQAPADPCDTGNCLAAQEARDGARRGVERACLLLKMAMVPLRTAVWIISRPLREYVIALIIAAIFGGLSGVLIAIAIYLGALLFIYAWLPVVNATGQTLVTAYEAETAAIADVVAECPADCQGETDPTSCDVVSNLPTTPWDRLLGLSQLSV